MKNRLKKTANFFRNLSFFLKKMCFFDIIIFTRSNILPMLTNIFRRHNRQPQAGCYVAPLISVCLPVYDTEPVLERCLRSVITQDYPNFEIVIVSDKSRGHDSNGRDAKQIALAMQSAMKMLPATILRSSMSTAWAAAGICLPKMNLMQFIQIRQPLMQHLES